MAEEETGKDFVVSAKYDEMEAKFTPKPLYSDDNKREKGEHTYGFSEEDIEKFAIRIETKAEKANKSSTEFVTGDVAADIQSMDQKDMQSVNLFGLPLDNYNRDTTQSGQDL